MSDLLNTNGTEYEFNPDAVDSIDQDSVEGGGPSYPVIQWAYGNMRDRKHGGVDGFGGFFVKAEKVDGATMEMLAAMGPNTAQDVQFNMDAAGKSAAVLTGSNGHMTAQDAADLGL